MLYDVLFTFYDQFKCDLTPMYFIKSILFLGSRWSVWVWVWQNFQKRTGTVRECAEQTAIVGRVCGCAKIGCTQILYYISYLIFEKIQWSIFLRCYISNEKIYNGQIYLDVKTILLSLEGRIHTNFFYFFWSTLILVAKHELS